MIIIKELHGYMEALAVGMWSKGAGQPLDEGDKIVLAQRALEKDLEGPWQDLQALIASIVGVTVMATIAELNKHGQGDVDPQVLVEMMQTLPLKVLNEYEIEIVDDEDQADEQWH